MAGDTRDRHIRVAGGAGKMKERSWDRVRRHDSSRHCKTSLPQSNKIACVPL